MKLKTRVIRSNRKSISLQISGDNTVIIRAPGWMSDRQIDDFFVEKSGWIEQQIRRMEKSRKRYEGIEPLSAGELRTLADRAGEILPERVAHFASILGVDYGRITIRNQRTRWGSCSSRGNLNFNCLLMLMPKEVQDYVVVHELCHRIEMNHSKRFWALVESVFPDYRRQEEYLKKEGDLISYNSAFHQIVNA